MGLLQRNSDMTGTTTEQDAPEGSLLSRLAESFDRSRTDREQRRMAAHLAWTDDQRVRFGGAAVRRG
ncbi:MAG: hypothetical protein AAFR47_11285 [Pseudomonadota bacterium]